MEEKQPERAAKKEDQSVRKTDEDMKEGTPKNDIEVTAEKPAENAATKQSAASLQAASEMRFLKLTTKKEWEMFNNTPLELMKALEEAIMRARQESTSAPAVASNGDDSSSYDGSDEESQESTSMRAISDEGRKLLSRVHRGRMLLARVQGGTLENPSSDENSDK